MAGASAPPDDRATALDSLPSPRRTAIENRTDLQFDDREPLAALDGAVVRANGTDYAVRLVVPCSTPYEEAALVGGFLLGYASLQRRFR